MNVIHQDMRDGFKKMDVHLATLDDAFLLSGVQATNIDDMRADDLVDIYHCTGFKLSANGDQVTLVGYKHVAYGQIDLASPKIAFEGAYQNKEDLVECIDLAKAEVEAYMNGKGEPRAKQTEIEFNENEEM